LRGAQRRSNPSYLPAFRELDGDSGKKAYAIYSAAFERLDPETQQLLLQREVVKERKKSQSPVMRILPA